MLAAITAIFAFQLAGEVLVVALGLPMPGPVAGMALFFLFLVIHGGVPQTVGAVSGTLLKHLALLFVPAGVGVLQHAARLETDGIGLVAAIIPSTLVAIVVTGWVLSRLRAGREAEK